MTPRPRDLWMAILAAACSTSPTEQQQEDLAVAEAHWRAAAPADYSFQFQRSCFCAPIATRAVAITVQHGVATSLTYVDDGTTADTSLFRDFLTIDRVFAFLDRALQTHPAAFVGTYDAHLGYPLQVSIDYIANAADDELWMQVGTFRIAN